MVDVQALIPTHSTILPSRIEQTTFGLIWFSNLKSPWVFWIRNHTQYIYGLRNHSAN